MAEPQDGDKSLEDVWRRAVGPSREFQAPGERLDPEALGEGCGRARGLEADGDRKGLCPPGRAAVGCLGSATSVFSKSRRAVARLTRSRSPGCLPGRTGRSGVAARAAGGAAPVVLRLRAACTRARRRRRHGAPPRRPRRPRPRPRPRRHPRGLVPRDVQPVARPGPVAAGGAAAAPPALAVPGHPRLPQQELRQRAGAGRRDPVHRAGRVLLPGDDREPAAVQPPRPPQGADHRGRRRGRPAGGAEALVRGVRGAVRDRRGERRAKPRPAPRWRPLAGPALRLFVRLGSTLGGFAGAWCAVGVARPGPGATPRGGRGGPGPARAPTLCTAHGLLTSVCSVAAGAQGAGYSVDGQVQSLHRSPEVMAHEGEPGRRHGNPGLRGEGGAVHSSGRWSQRGLDEKQVTMGGRKVLLPLTQPESHWEGTGGRWDVGRGAGRGRPPVLEPVATNRWLARVGGPWGRLRVPPGPAGSLLRPQDVIQVSKKFLPGMAVGYSSSKLTLHVGDGFEFMKQNQDAFDVIITDSSDPMGPAESLFKESYYQLMKTALKDNGVLCCQGECQWLHLDLIKQMRQFCKSLFPVVAYAYCTIPTYPSGQIGFMLCSKNPSTDFQKPVQQLTQKQVEQMQLKYYNSDVHQAAFVLPEFARKALNDVS